LLGEHTLIAKRRLCQPSATLLPHRIGLLVIGIACLFTRS
jgi:hypothetical protein